MLKTKHHYISIKYKFIMIILCLAIIMVTISGFFAYRLQRDLLRNVISHHNEEIAIQVSNTLSMIILEEIDDIKVYVSNVILREALASSNLMHSNKSAEEIKTYMIEMDEKWASAKVEDTLVNKYTESIVGIGLQNIMENDFDVAEIFVTDKYGGLVAASNKTTDFYQADEEWWQKTINIDQPDVYIDDIVFDESINRLGFALAVSIKDELSNNIGVCKIVLDAKRIFEPLDKFELSETGHAVLVDGDGFIIYHKNSDETRSRFLPENMIWKDLKQADSSWLIIDSPHVHDTEMLVAYSKVNNSFLLSNNIEWRVFIDQDVKEVFKPLKGIFLKQLLLVIILILLLIPFGYLIGYLLLKPMKQIIIGLEQIGKGNLSYNIDIKNKDEFGLLADSINNMSSNLKLSTTSITRLNKEITAHKKAAESLAESQIRYKTIYNSSSDAVMLLIPGGCFVSGNDSTIEMFGCIDESDFIKYTPADFSPEYQPDGTLSSIKAKEIMDIAVEKGSHLFEWVHKRVNGEEFYASVLLTSMSLHGEVILQATVRDISDRKKIESEIESLSRFPSENPNPILRVSAEGAVIYKNEATGKILEKNGFKNSDVYKILPQDFVKITKESLTNAKVIRDLEVSIGKNTYSYSVIPISKNDYVNFYAVDVTARKFAEEKVKQYGKEWQDTFDAISDLVFIQDQDFRIVKANKAFLDAMGSKAEDIIGRKCHEVLHKTETPWPECPFKEAKKSKKATVREVDDPAIGKPLLVAVSPIFNDEGEIVAAVHIATDITELRKVDNLKDQFVSTVSHELRTPLSITKEGLALVLDEIVGKLSLKQKNILNMSKDNIDRLARIIDDLLDISKMESGKLELRRSIFDISGLIRETCLRWKSQAEEKNQDIDILLTGDHVDISADRDRVTQILDNLISNAIKYTPIKGKIFIELKDLDDKVKIFVTDTGVGIEKSDLGNVFNKFQQFGRTAGAGSKGTGLGLAIVKDLVVMHGGDVSVESEIGKGSIFSFTIPK